MIDFDMGFLVGQVAWRVAVVGYTRGGLAGFRPFGADQSEKRLRRTSCVIVSFTQTAWIGLFPTFANVVPNSLSVRSMLGSLELPNRIEATIFPFYLVTYAY